MSHMTCIKLQLLEDLSYSSLLLLSPRYEQHKTPPLAGSGSVTGLISKGKAGPPLAAQG